MKLIGAEKGRGSWGGGGGQGVGMGTRKKSVLLWCKFGINIQNRHVIFNLLLTHFFLKKKKKKKKKKRV